MSSNPPVGATTTGPQRRPSEAALPDPWDWLMHGLPVTRLRLTLAPRAALRVPEWPGSLLRGALGHALAALDRPAAVPDDAYADLYRGQRVRLRGENVVADDIPRPYVVEWPAASCGAHRPGERFDFDVVLFGRAAAHAPAIVASADLAAERGLGERRVPCQLLNARVLEDAMPLATAAPALPAGELHRVELQAISPLALAKAPAPARRPDGGTFLRALHRRARMLAHFHGEHALPASTPALPDCAMDGRALRWIAPERRSTPQGRRFKVGGLVGPFALDGSLEAVRPLLRAATVLHVGRHAPLGHGRLEPVRVGASGVRTGRDAPP